MSRQDRLLLETAVILSADIFVNIYTTDDEHGGNYQTTAQRVIELAKQFEKELNWQPDDNRNFLEELEKFENRILDELKGPDDDKE